MLDRLSQDISSHISLGQISVVNSDYVRLGLVR
jgi:hypothetical protein